LFDLLLNPKVRISNMSFNLLVFATMASGIHVAGLHIVSPQKNMINLLSHPSKSPDDKLQAQREDHRHKKEHHHNPAKNPPTSALGHNAMAHDENACDKR
jgi:hypothetical protein